MFELDGQTAIVTGAASGIGEVIAKRLSSAGALVAIADINDKAAAAVQQAIGSVLARTQSIEIIVNNAGMQLKPRRYGSSLTRTGAVSWPLTSPGRSICAGW